MSGEGGTEGKRTPTFKTPFSFFRGEIQAQPSSCPKPNSFGDGGTGVAEIQLFDYMQMTASGRGERRSTVAALVSASRLPPLCSSSSCSSGSRRDGSYMSSLATQLTRVAGGRTGGQAGRRPLPSAIAFIWSHVLCKTVVLFTRNCYQR